MNWDFLNDIVNSNDISFEVTVFRLALSFLAGALVGADRQKRMHPAGLRTHTLICMGATLVMIISIYIPQTFIDFRNGDPGRIAAQAVSGIGFLGAGAIIKFGANVRGLTTAASIWLISTVGLAIGCGLYLTSFVCLMFILFILKGLDFLEKRLFSVTILKSFIIEVKGDVHDKELFTSLFEACKIKILNTDISYSIEKDIKVYNFALELSDKVDLEELGRAIGLKRGFISYKMLSL
ncbi:MAG: MgtC/SapB family protein [Marinifilaceae bacterium]